MLQIHVDGQAFTPSAPTDTYEALLSVLDSALAPESRIVTAVRINGVEEPAFREESARGRPLAPADVVDVDTRTVQELAHDALADTVRLMPSVSDAARNIGEQLGRADGPADAEALSELAEGLTLLVTLVQAAAAWADAGNVPRGDWLGQHVVQVASCIDAVNEGQRDGDWVGVADALTYDLVPAIEQWRGTLAQALATFGDAAAAEAPRHAP